MKKIPQHRFRIGALGGALMLFLSLGLRGADRPWTEEGFAIPSRPDLLVFPAAHGSHPEFRLEWWYLTGHLYTNEGRRFGFQATFFRTAPDSTGEAAREETEKQPTFGHHQVHLAHMALIDPDDDRYLHQERIHREGWAASAEVGRLDVRNGNWRLKMTDPETETLVLRGGIEPTVRFDLNLTPTKPRVLFGEDGISRKGDQPTSRSYYITFPRLEVSGTLRQKGQTFEVTGQAWMDHEITSGQLTAEQTGWDWVSMQLDNGEELMAFRLRRKDGSMDPYSYLAHVDEAGEVRHFQGSDFGWENLIYWESPRNGGRYPISFRLHLPPELDRGEAITFEPLRKDQEFSGRAGGPVYWEGAGDLRQDNRRIGVAFLEMTGYGEEMGGLISGE